MAPIVGSSSPAVTDLDQECFGHRCRGRV